MSANYKQIAAQLYEMFGDQGLEWVRAQADAYFNDTAAPETEDGPIYVEEVAEEAPADETPYEDGETFVADTEHAVHTMAVDSIQSPEQVAEVMLGLVMMAGEVRKFEEAQITKRVGIAAERDIALANIRAQQELLQNYLDRSFDERADNFNKLFTVVDAALETGNMQALGMGLESVVKLATSSPFKDLRSIEDTAAALADPDHEWDF